MNTEETPKSMLKGAAGIIIIFGIVSLLHSNSKSIRKSIYSTEDLLQESFREETGWLREDVHTLQQEVRKMATALQSMQEVLQRVETLHELHPSAGLPENLGSNTETQN